MKRFLFAALGIANIELALWTMPIGRWNLVIGIIWTAVAVCWHWRHNPFSK